MARIDYPDATFSTYKYDPFGRRMEKDLDDGAGGRTVKRYIYDGPDIALEYDGTNTQQARYTHGARTDQPLVAERGGQSYYYHNDHQGSIRLVTDGAGTPVNTYDYGAYGNADTAVETLDQPYRYTSREFDGESGLYYYRARYYDADTGRFISEDPSGFAAGDLNLFRYVLNDPVNLVDPTGGMAKKKYEKSPNPNQRKGAEQRQQSGERERNVGPKNKKGEEHSRRPKGGFRPPTPPVRLPFSPPIVDPCVIMPDLEACRPKSPDGMKSCRAPQANGSDRS